MRIASIAPSLILSRIVPGDRSRTQASCCVERWSCTSALDAGELPLPLLRVGIARGALDAAGVAHLDQGRLPVAVLPARLELDLVSLPEEPEDHVVAGAATVDRHDGRLVGGQRQEGQHLAEVTLQLRADVLRGRLDVPGIERITERRGAVANGVDVHRTLLSSMAPSATGARPRRDARCVAICCRSARTARARPASERPRRDPCTIAGMDTRRDAPRSLPVLAGEGLTLRPGRAGDEAALRAVFESPEVV